MNKLPVVLYFVLAAFCPANASSLFDKVDAFLCKHVENGQVKYGAIKAAPEEMNQIVAALANFDLDELSSETARKAFWINAYNIVVIHAVVRAYPIDSPMDVPGFFDTKTYPVAGDTLTLNEIENQKLRADFGDPRIHFALVCAAKSCPPLIPEAYWPEKLDAQLEERTRANLNDNDFIRVTETEKTVSLSEIFKWYREDFVTPECGLLAYINGYRNQKIPSTYTVDYYSYNWELNEHK